ncbi:MAG: FlgD immunoglobulin-like domain containing protein [Candidatus Cloacimonetes bacterium]|nr:FlgD immunoglobulin-like domain containing protein [Candidatus Cloacimonadota bacterium]
MKRLILIAGIICLSLGGLFALALEPEAQERAQSEKNLDSGILSVKNSNYAYDKDLQHISGVQLSHKGGIWISGIKARRDADGELLYWLSFPPTASNQEIVNQDHELWTPDLVVARDSLSSIAYDGDRDLYELLPAYNPLLYPNTDVAHLYQEYNEQDKVLQSFMGVPSPLPFEPFDSENYCFSIPQPLSFDTPGILTNSAYYYDYCPFGTTGDRDLGLARNTNTHVPLGLAIHQESYAWDLQNYCDMLITKYTIYNANDYDTIDNMAISYYLDADIGPSTWGAVIASDDKSGYIKGEGYEFAYSFDADFDDGASPWYVANKLMVPGFAGEHAAWYWKVGDGPDDFHATNYSYSNNRTPNEKYWLATGRNPNVNKIQPLRLPWGDNYEQEVPNDTRFLNSVYGEGDSALSLAPGAALSFYVAQFIGTSIDELKDKSLFIEDFLAGGLALDPDGDYISMPHLGNIESLPPRTFRVNWFSFANPDHFELKYKEYDAPASHWNTIEVDGNLRTYDINVVNYDTWYEIKIGAVYYTPDEVYLETPVKLAHIYYSANSELVAPAVVGIRNYPNPFQHATRIEFALEKSAPLGINIYNLKGQKVRSLSQELYKAGSHNVEWDGKDDKGKACPMGVYYVQLKSEGRAATKKLLRIK